MAKTYERRGAAVKRLLRCRNTRRYFKDDGWTENPEEARCFRDVVEVATTCARRGLMDVELALREHCHGPDLFCTRVR